MQTKTSRLIFPLDKSRVGIFPCLNIYSPVASACVGVRFFQNDGVSVWEGHTWVRCLSHTVHISTAHSVKQQEVRVHVLAASCTTLILLPKMHCL